VALKRVALSDRAWCVDHATSVAVVENDRRAFMVDAGLDENLARKMVNDLAQRGIALEAVVVTHAHADHFGGAAFAAARTGARVLAPAVDALTLGHPDLEPWTLWAAAPPPDVVNKFLRGPETPVNATLAPGPATLAGLDVTVHALPGHTPGQIGVGADGVLFVADALLGEAVLAKHPVPFSVDPDAARASAARVAGLGYDVVHAYHGGRVSDVSALVAMNVAAYDAAEAAALEAFDAPRGVEEAFARVASRWPSPPGTVGQWVLDAASFRGTVAALARRGRLAPVLERGALLWKRA